LLSTAQISALPVFLIGALVAWAAITFLRRPFDRFRSLRSQVASLLRTYEPNVRNRHDERSRKWLAKRARELKALGGELLRLTEAHSLLSHTLGWFGYHPKRAGDALIELASLGPGETSRAELRVQAQSALKLRS
jgi:hypothetical protein